MSKIEKSLHAARNAPGQASSPAVRSFGPLGKLLDRLYNWFPFAPIDWLSRRPSVAILTIGGFGFAGSAAVGLVFGIPRPIFHDEFTYLLQADTFAHGRLTNATPPLWQHLETFHVILTPSYAGKYPPAQGLVLALGQVLEHPVLGVWLSVGLMGAVLTWMLLAYSSARWAVIGGILALLYLGIADYWGQSYWGGALPATGGALLYGAIPRILKDPRTKDAIILGLGLAILANSRPFEGLVVSIPAAVVIIGDLLRGPGLLTRTSLARVVLPIVMVLMMTAGFMLYYNEQVTGNPLQLPHQLYRQQYALTPVFLWQEAPSPHTYSHATIAAFWKNWAWPHYASLLSWKGFLVSFVERSLGSVVFLFGPGLAVLAFLPRSCADRWIRVAAIALLLLVGATTLSVWWQPHYLAPGVGMAFAIVSAGFMNLEGYRGRWIVGRRLLMLVFLGYLALFLVDVARTSSPKSFSENRAEIQRILERQDGLDLVIIRYGPHHNIHEEWVYNEAELQTTPIIWARDMEISGNQALIDYYTTRHVWRLDVDRDAKLHYVRGPDIE